MQVVINTMLLQEIGCPATLLERKPGEKLAFTRAFSPPKQVDASEGLLPEEEGLVG